ncbi:oligopeptide/dipeptide ABC transporter ATP-binding protein [Anaerosporobacter sp.]|uniref:oligopeptide/dipeptide ABC transporter ATP-binding protein n=1 Tax=Anaerosporobacter sp. TaxID=1872529 RepID=UPI00286F2FDB|nr:oligopeptide/dipeptide ABC transporter ATP-binding protein [Anaerosporobacter sp.]
MENKKKDKKILLRISNLKQYFPIKKSSMFQKEQLYVRANDGISLDIYEGETFGLVGESGCGKSTFGRTLLQLYKQTDGRTMYYGRPLDEIAPLYMEDTLKNLSSKMKALEGHQAKADTLQKEYDNLKTDEEKYAVTAKLNEAKKIANDAFLDIVQVIGGFYISKNLEKVSEVFLKEYRANVALCIAKEELRKLESELDAVKAESKAKNTALSKAQAKVDVARKDVNAKNEIFIAAKKEIDAMKKEYAGNAEFDKYESYLDEGVDLARLSEEETRRLRKDLQLIFQDPYSSLNPRMSVGQIIGEGLNAHKVFHKNKDKMQDYIMQIMEDCGLAPYMIHRYPHQFSGGQRQRIGIARSLALKPKFVVCDEAVSALDVSIQSQIINLLLDLKEKENLTYLFISHDLSVIKYISDRIGVMYLGNMVELATTADLFDAPMHPYTEALLSAIPTTDVENKKEAILIEGDIPSPINPPKACKFHTRCKYCTDICTKVEPEFEEVTPGHFVACHHKRNVVESM